MMMLKYISLVLIFSLVSLMSMSNFAHQGEKTTDIEITPMSYDIYDVLDGWEIVDGPSITNVTYPTTPEYTAVQNTIEYSIFAVGGPASFMCVVVDYIYDRLEDEDFGGTYTKSYYVREKVDEGPGNLSLYQYAWKTLIFDSPIMSDYHLYTVKTRHDGGIRYAED